MKDIKQKSIAVVVGTGRSGTSIIANMLHVLNINMGEKFVPHNYSNPTGTYEDIDFASVNSDYLNGDISLEKWKSRVKDYIKKRDNKYEMWGWKIPSTSNLIEEYLHILPEAQYIWCKRDKNEFIDSCRQAYGWDSEKSKQLYNYRMSKLNEHLSTKHNVIIINYKDIRSNTLDVVERLISFMELKNITKDIKKKAVNVVLSKEKERKLKDKMRRELSKSKSGKRVLLGLPNGSGYFPFQTVEALLKLHKPPEVMLQIIARLRIDKARNKMFKTVLESGSDYIFFVDDDNPPPVNALMKMLEDDKDIVTAPILQRGEPYDICLFNKNIKEIDGYEITLYDNLKKLQPRNGDLQQVDATGLGCCLIKRRVVEVLMNKYDGRPFDFVIEQYGDRERRLGEDVAFSERAINEGFEIWADVSIRPVHLGANRIIQVTDNLIE